VRRDIKAPLDAIHEAHARRDAGVAKFSAMTPAQIEKWIDAADMNDIKTALKMMAKIVVPLALKQRRNGP
jgi:hypothetical protein